MYQRDNTPATVSGSALATYPSPPEWLATRTTDDRKRRRHDGTPKNTRRAMETAARIFGAWCERHGLAWLPASPESVALFLEQYASGEWTPDRPASQQHLTGQPVALATVKARLAGINALHRSFDLPAPGTSQIVKEAVKALSRTKGSRQEQAAPLDAEAIARIMAALDAEAFEADTSTRSGHRKCLTALRDAALIALAYDTFGRRSEIVALNAEDMERDSDGSAAALIRQSKTDQDGEGAFAYASPDTMRRLRTWTDAAQIATGPLFPPIGPNARGERLDGADVLRIMRRRAKSAGIANADQITGHSTRVGAAQDAMAAGCDILAIQQAGRWKSARMPARYGERLAVKRSAAAQLAKAQGRT